MTRILLAQAVLTVWIGWHQVTASHYSFPSQEITSVQYRPIQVPYKYPSTVVTVRKDDFDKCRCVPDKYRQHYVTMGCRGIMSSECPKCVERYDCPNITDTTSADDENYYKCEYDGNQYDVNEVVVTQNPCNRCRCSPPYSGEGGGRPVITCASTICPQPITAEHKRRNCYVQEAEGSCCGNIYCPSDEQMVNLTKCHYQGSIYRVGEKFRLFTDTCRECVCDNNWNETDYSAGNCRKVACDIGIRMDMLRRGCVPLYTEYDCCPIEYECPPKNEKANDALLTGHADASVCRLPVERGPCLGYYPRYAYNNGACEQLIYGGCRGNRNNFYTRDECERTCAGVTGDPRSSEVETETGSDTEGDDDADESDAGASKPSKKSKPADLTCKFGRKWIGYRQALYIKSCASCQCTVPPMLTCVTKSCGPPYGRNCAIISDANGCCPTYSCSGY